jgi:hypothetical protein
MCAEQPANIIGHSLALDRITAGRKDSLDH